MARRSTATPSSSKPASLSPHIGLLLVEALVQARHPKGVVNYVTGSGRSVGDTLVASKDVHGVSFTGSVFVGRKIYEQAMKNLTRVQLEMGGKNPMIVLDDADIDTAVKLAVVGGFGVTERRVPPAAASSLEELSNPTSSACRLVKPPRTSR
ncbi:MAG: aldehyde dehydrogenase family protein [Caldilineaceae bacterium]